MSAIAALGVDIGSTTAKLAGVDAAGSLVFQHLEDSDPRVEAQVERLFAAAVAAGAAPGTAMVSTGYGRNLVKRAERAVTEISCHAKGVFRAMGHGGTLVDIGGQDSKVIVIGQEGSVASFSMNDKCAAGTGRFLEVVAGRLKLSLDQLSETGLSVTEEVPISSTCTVFAESEIISLIAKGSPLEQIVRGLYRSLIKRVAALARSAGAKPPMMLSGGVARSRAVRELLSQELGHPVQVPPNPQVMGAYGAALVALGKGGGRQA